MNYPRMAQTAQRLIDANGRNVTIIRTTGEKRDNVTGEIIAPGSEERFPMRGVLTNFDAKMIDGTLITNRDRKLMICGEVKPETGDAVKIGEDTAGKIIAVINEVNPGGTPILYELQVRI